MLAMVLIPAALTYTFGKMVWGHTPGLGGAGDDAHPVVALASLACIASNSAIRTLPALGVDQTASLQQPGGNMEGKEARFGIGASALFGTISTSTSSGAVNSMHDSFTPLGGLVPLFNMQLGESCSECRHGSVLHADLRDQSACSSPD